MQRSPSRSFSRAARYLRNGACAVALVFAGSNLAQAQFVDADTIAAARALSDAESTVDRLIEGVEIPGGKFALAALRRERAETNGLIHNQVTEIYYITDGSGTLVLGGSLTDTNETDLTRVWAGPSTSGVHQDGTVHQVAPGDVIVIPAGTAHRFSELSGVIKYLVFRFEPE